MNCNHKCSECWWWLNLESGHACLLKGEAELDAENAAKARKISHVNLVSWFLIMFTTLVSIVKTLVR